MFATALFANLGPESGPIRRRHHLIAIGVVRARGARTTVGMALSGDPEANGVAHTEATGHGDDVATWLLIVGEAKINLLTDQTIVW